MASGSPAAPPQLFLSDVAHLDLLRLAADMPGGHLGQADRHAGAEDEKGEGRSGPKPLFALRVHRVSREVTPKSSSAVCHFGFSSFYVSAMQVRFINNSTVKGRTSRL